MHNSFVCLCLKDGLKATKLSFILFSFSTHFYAMHISIGPKSVICVCVCVCVLYYLHGSYIPQYYPGIMAGVVNGIDDVTFYNQQ